MQAVLDHIVNTLPTTWWAWILHIVAGAAASLFILSVLEHQIHRNMMHLRNLPKFVYKLTPIPGWLQVEHAVWHHGHWYKQFDYEPDEEGRHQNINTSYTQTFQMGTLFAPIWLGMGYFSPVAAVSFCVLGIVHNRSWNIVHTQMHMPANTWWKDSAFFRLLGRHHFMHHMQPLKNFNVVIPCADFLFGSVAQPRLGDVREMLRLTYLKPRSARAKQLVAKMAPRPGYAAPTEPLPLPDAERMPIAA